MRKKKRREEKRREEKRRKWMKAVCVKERQQEGN